MTALALRLRRLLRVVETTVLVALFALMFGVAVFQILARNLFGGGLVWGQDLVQVAMLWVTMAGAYIAVGDNRHIRIDVVARFGGERLQAIASRLSALFAATLCGALGWYAIEFVHWDFVDKTPGVGSVPAWMCEVIIPVAAGAMALRFLLQAISPPVASDSAAPDSAVPDSPAAQHSAALDSPSLDSPAPDSASPDSPAPKP